MDQFLVDQLESLLLCIPPGDAAPICLAHGFTLCLISKGRVNLEQHRSIRILAFTGFQGIGHDFHDGLAQLLLRQPQWNRIVVTLGHLAPILPRQHCDVLIYNGFGQHKMLAVMMVESLGYVSGHLQVLYLVLTHRDVGGVEHQYVSGHQHRVAEQAHVDRKVRVFACFGVVLHHGFVGVGSVHQALGC